MNKLIGKAAEMLSGKSQAYTDGDGGAIWNINSRSIHGRTGNPSNPSIGFYSCFDSSIGEIRFDCATDPAFWLCVNLEGMSEGGLKALARMATEMAKSKSKKEPKKGSEKEPKKSVKKKSSEKEPKKGARKKEKGAQKDTKPSKKRKRDPAAAHTSMAKLTPKATVKSQSSAD